MHIYTCNPDIEIHMFMYTTHLEAVPIHLRSPLVMSGTVQGEHQFELQTHPPRRSTSRGWERERDMHGTLTDRDFIIFQIDFQQRPLDLVCCLCETVANCNVPHAVLSGQGPPLHCNENSEPHKMSRNANASETNGPVADLNSQRCR